MNNLKDHQNSKVTLSCILRLDLQGEGAALLSSSSSEGKGETGGNTMSMIDYLLWRGDLRFEQSEFCEVDNLVLCYLTYVNLDGIAPEIGEGTMTVRELSDRFFLQYSHKEL